MYDKAKDIGEVSPKSERPYADTTSTPQRLQRLLETDPLAADGFTPACLDVDYLANNGAELEAAIAQDPTAQKRLMDVAALFNQAERESMAFITEALNRTLP
jgi:transaldolase